MTQYILRRLALLIPVVMGVTFLAHSMLLLTGDPASALAGEHATPEMREALRERLGLNDPLPIQYGRFLLRIARGDLGRSIMTRSPVVAELRLFFPATIELALAAVTMAVLMGVPLGALAGYKHNTLIDLGTMFSSLVGVSMPIFWLALMLLWVFGLKLDWFPTTGRLDPGVQLRRITNLYVVDSALTGNARALTNSLHHLALPALALSTIPMQVAGWAADLEVSRYIVLAVIILIYLFLGCFLDAISMMVLTMPVIYPVVLAMNFDPIWFGILYTMNMEMGFLTPPFGFNLFYMKAVVPPSITMGDIYRSIIPFVGLQALSLAIVMVFPQIALWLPSTMMGG